MATCERVIVFDVNETLLDIESLNPFFEQTFGEARVMRQWFSELIIYSQSLTLSGSYTPFGQLAVAVLKMVADIRGVTLSEDNISAFQAKMAVLPAHPDAEPALKMLHNAGFRLITLTNSSTQAGREVLEKSGLASYFERQFSVEEVKQFKPASETYNLVAQALGLDGGSLRLVAAHTWDTLGAISAGWKGAMVTRPGNAVLSVGVQPDIVGNDLVVVARKIIESDRED